MILSKSPLIQAFNVDCLDFMRDKPDKYWSLAIVDPPYGIDRDKGFGGFGGFGKPIARKKYHGEWDNNTPSKEYFTELLRVCDHVIIWGGQFFTDKLPIGGHWIFWDKLNTMPTFGDGELAYTNFDRNSVKRKVIEYNGLIGKEKLPRIHPTQKPVQLYEWLLMNYAKPGNTILDTHGGSMGIAIACFNLEFDLDVCELDADYFKDATKRVKEHIAKPKGFFAYKETLKKSERNLLF